MLLAGLLVCQEETCGLHYDLGAHLVPLQVGGIHLGGQTDLLTVYYKVAVLYGHLVVEAAVNGVILQHVGQILGIQQVVDTYDLNVIGKFVDCSAEYHAADTAETIDTNFNFCHCSNYLKSAAKIGILMELIYICAQICIKKI